MRPGRYRVTYGPDARRGRARRRRATAATRPRRSPPRAPDGRSRGSRRRRAGPRAPTSRAPAPTCGYRDREAVRARPPMAQRRRSGAPVPPNGRMTTTAIPSSSARGSRRFSASRSRGFSGSWTTSNRRVRSARSSSPNEPALQCVTPMRSMRPAARSSSSHGRCSSQATRLCTCSISTRPKKRRCSSYCARPSSTLGVQIFVATRRSVAPRVERCAERRLRARRTSATSRRSSRRHASAASTTGELPSRRLRRTFGTCRARRRGRGVAASIAVTLAQRGSDFGGRQGGCHVHVRRLDREEGPRGRVRAPLAGERRTASRCSTPT